jgi:hypothetical protein
MNADFEEIVHSSDKIDLNETNTGLAILILLCLSKFIEKNKDNALV